MIESTVRIPTPDDEDRAIHLVIDVQCPYCGHRQSHWVDKDSTRRSLALCEIDQGGCDRDFVVNVRLLAQVESLPIGAPVPEHPADEEVAGFPIYPGYPYLLAWHRMADMPHDLFDKDMDRAMRESAPYDALGYSEVGKSWLRASNLSDADIIGKLMRTVRQIQGIKEPK